MVTVHAPPLPTSPAVPTAPTAPAPDAAPAVSPNAAPNAAPNTPATWRGRVKTFLVTQLRAITLTGAVAAGFSAYQFFRDREILTAEEIAEMLDRLGKEGPDIQIRAIDSLETVAAARDKYRPTIERGLVIFVNTRTARPRVTADPCADSSARAAPPAVLASALNAVGRIGRLPRGASAGAGVNLARTDLRDVVLADSLSFRGADLSHACLARTHWGAVDLTGAKLDGASLDSATLDGATLTRARLRSARLRWARLTGAVADSVDLGKADLTAAVLDGARARGAHLVGTTLTCAVLDRATLADADWTDARLSWAYAERATLDAPRNWDLIAEARGAYLYGAAGLPSDAPAWAAGAEAQLARLTQLEWRERRRAAYREVPACGEP